MFKLIVAILSFVFLILTEVSAQQIILKGRISDEVTGEALPFANLVLQGTLSGTSSDSIGRFQLNLFAGRKRDTLLVSALGYEMQKVAITALAEHFITIELKPSAVNLKEAIIRPGENPAFRIMRKVIAAKAKNNPESLEALEYEVYHKVEFDMNHFTEKIKKNLFLRSFNFIFNNADTTADGVNYLPILLTESNSENYYRKNPPTTKELVKGRRSVGLKGPKIMKFAEDMYIAPDIFKEFVVILDKNFPSPIIDNFKNHYRYYLIDSLYLNGEKHFYIQFKPKQSQDIAFTGEMYIRDSSFAVTQIDLSFSINANVNFVRNYWIRQEYHEIENTLLLHKSQVIGDFTVVENSKEMTGFFGKKTSVYRNYKINQPRDNAFYANLDRITFEDSASIRSEDFWVATRNDSLTAQEKSIVSMMDTLEQQPKFRLLKNSVKSITSGWIPVRKFEIGDFYSFYSYNNIEQSRIKIGLRAQHLFNDRLSFKSYLAYGTHDERFKYLTETRWVLTRKRSRETRVGAKFRNDAIQPGRSSTIFPLDHVLNSFSNLGSFSNRALVKEYSGFIERQWFSGFSTRLSVSQTNWENFDRSAFVERVEKQITLSKASYSYSFAALELRYAFGERNLSASFGDGMRSASFPEVPVFSLRYEKAFKEFLSSDFNADKLKLRIEERLRMRRFGYSLFRLEAGKTWGTLPYQLLETPTANPILFADETAFNLMNYLEFISDQYASMMWEHHFEGFFLNRIPVIKKLKWRELILAKCYAGSLSNKNKNSIYQRPSSIGTLSEPYIEVGAGIENIFKFSRVDFLWRITYRGYNSYYDFIAKPMIQFKF